MKKIYSSLYVIAVTILAISVSPVMCMDTRKGYARRMTSAEFNAISILKSIIEFNQFSYLKMLLKAKRIEEFRSGLRQIPLRREDMTQLFFMAATYKNSTICQFLIKNYPTAITTNVMAQAGITCWDNPSMLKYRDEHSQTLEATTNTDIFTTQAKY